MPDIFCYHASLRWQRIPATSDTGDVASYQSPSGWVVRCFIKARRRNTRQVASARRDIARLTAQFSRVVSAMQAFNTQMLRMSHVHGGYQCITDVTFVTKYVYLNNIHTSAICNDWNSAGFACRTAIIKVSPAALRSPDLSSNAFKQTLDT